MLPSPIRLYYIGRWWLPIASHLTIHSIDLVRDVQSDLLISHANKVLAIHLQKLYDRLKDYEPTVEYRHRLDQISKAVGPLPNQENDLSPIIGQRGIWQSLLAQKEKRDSLALTRTLTSQEAALNLDSPKGLMLHGEVGTGKSMLIDLFADCLPNRKKARWHFNTFILETFAKLEQLRRDRLIRIPPSVNGSEINEHSLLWLARDLINTSPILFLDEFQLPDRAASKIMTNLMTSFFQLGGVLIATSNRMPEELHKAAGMTFTPPPSRISSIGARLGLRSGIGKGDMFGQSEFSGFLDVLKARCEVWEMQGGKDYRRQEVDFQAPPVREGEVEVLDDFWQLDDHQDLQRAPGISQPAATVSSETAASIASELAAASTLSDLSSQTQPKSPRNYLIRPGITASTEEIQAYEQQLASLTSLVPTAYTPSTLSVYGRTIHLPQTYKGILTSRFADLCSTIAFGPADYISLASAYHTIILTDVPTLSLLQKNEARRFITLLDALYEARCKLLILNAAAGPDDLFFPDQAKKSSSDNEDAVYAETFSEAYQDATAPFRPNISSSNPDFSEPEAMPEPDYTHSRFEGMLSPDALEDDPPNRVRREAQSSREKGPIDPDDNVLLRHTIQRNQAHGAPAASHGPDFGKSGAFTGEDEKFAFKRAQSRIWEMCSAKWWGRVEDGWHRPLPESVRRWERSSSAGSPRDSAVYIADQGVVQGDTGATATMREGMGHVKDVDKQEEEVLFRHGASPFRVAQEAPPKFSWTHVWGTMKWGKKAGAWGQGVEGLEERKKERQIDAQKERERWIKEGGKK